MVINNVDILLHVCCANCAVGCVERLKSEGLSIVLFFSNSNLDTEAEYGRRLDDVGKLAENSGLILHVDPYDHSRWLAYISGLESEPEKGERCRKCFEFALNRAYTKALELEVGSFATSLTVSPHKDSAVIFEVGSGMAGFDRLDFKKMGGFQRSVELSKAAGFYRQSYCGCEFSALSKKQR